MSDTTQGQGRSVAQQLKTAGTSLDTLPQQQYAPKAKTNMATDTQNLLNLAAESVGRIFDHGAEKITKTEEMCKVARQALDNKRNAVNRAMAEYLAASEAVHNATESAQSALSEIIISADAIGT